MILATSTSRLVHRVRLRHESTGESLTPLSAQADDLPYGWSLRVRGGDVVVSSRDGAPVPAVPPTLVVSVADPRLALLVTTPTVTVPLVGADITVDVPPVLMTLTVELVRPTTGAPSTGRTVTARATSGANPRPSIALPEVSPGVYQSDPVLWTARFIPLDLRVDGSLLRQVAVDFTRTATRVRLVDTV